MILEENLTDKIVKSLSDLHVEKSVIFQFPRLVTQFLSLIQNLLHTVLFEYV